MTEDYKSLLFELMEDHPTDPDRVYMNLLAFHSFQQSMNINVEMLSGKQRENIRLFGMEVIVGTPYDEELYVLDSERYPTAGDFKEGRVSAENLSTCGSK